MCFSCCHEETRVRPGRQTKGQKGPVDMLPQALEEGLCKRNWTVQRTIQHGLVCPVLHMVVQSNQPRNWEIFSC